MLGYRHRGCGGTRSRVANGPLSGGSPIGNSSAALIVVSVAMAIPGATASAAQLAPRDAVAACISGLDCSLNGVCANGACACDPGWHGPACELLSLGASPASAAQGAAYGFGKPFATTSWGGNAIFAAGGDEQWHLFVTEIAGAGCGLHAWQGQSTVVHATASSASGPYERVGVAVEHQAHNPQTIVINGSY